MLHLALCEHHYLTLGGISVTSWISCKNLSVQLILHQKTSIKGLLFFFFLHLNENKL